jgi:Extensin-like protein C-terminus
MRGGALFSLAGVVLLLALAGCGRSFLHTAERAPWRHDAEVSCLKSGHVKIGTGVVQMQPIEGPGVCGADFPLKVALLGESSALGYADDLRPPGTVPAREQPNWPPTEQRFYTPTAPVQPVQSAPLQNGNMRWVPGPQGVERHYESQAPARYEPREDRGYDQRPPVRYEDRYAPERYEAQPPARYEAPYDRSARPRYMPPAETRYDNRYTSAPSETPAGEPLSINPPNGAAEPDDIPDDAVLPPGRARPRYRQPAYNAPVYQPEPRSPPSLGPMRGPSMAAAGPATLTPAATLACPLVSALDRWVSESVQPAAMRWFGAPVTEIKQISAYSCREMVGSGTSTISEHAFGNALDIAGFTLADGRKISVQHGWRGTPEEQGFLHDVQLAACENFSTVLAPGYNAAHYNHIHVDLMRRSSGRRPCRPEAIPGEVVAAKARAVYASKQRGPAYTGSIPTKAGDKEPVAVPGQDGYVTGDENDAIGNLITTGRPHLATNAVDHEFVLEPGASILPRAEHAASLPRAEHKAPAEDRMTVH